VSEETKTVAELREEHGLTREALAEGQGAPRLAAGRAGF